MRKLLIALLSFALTSSVGAQSCCDRDRAKRVAEAGLYPAYTALERNAVGVLATGSAVMDAAGEKYSFCGNLAISDNSTSKTMTGADPQASISWIPGTTTFADTSGSPSTLIVSIQDIDETNGPPGRPDETADVSATLVAGTDTISSNTWRTDVMETGSAKTMNRGSVYCVVWDLSARGGGATDSVTVSRVANSATTQMPFAGIKTGGGWAADNASPNVILSADDATLMWLENSYIASSAAGTTYATSSNPDEYALICTAEYDFSAKGVFAYFGLTDGGGGEFIIYVDPETSPSILTLTNGSNASITLDADQSVSSGILRTGYFYFPYPTSRITAGRKFAVALRATTATNVALARHTIASASYMAAYSGGTNCYEGTRDGNSGVFAAVTTVRPFIGVVLDAVYTSR